MAHSRKPATGGGPEPAAVRRRLLAWYDRARRALPWRDCGDPYRVWVSEVMLQQTQVATVIPYYERFVARFPTLEALARASEDDVLGLWAGLGYYARARNLLKAARAVRPLGGLPDRFEDLLGLPGFGRYTAGAVASIAFGRRVPCVDGNVTRVLARLWAVGGDPKKGRAARAIGDVAARLVPPGRPGDFNQALMELGATVCVPDAPRCPECPLRRLCRARARGLEGRIPPRRSARSEPVAAVIGVCLERGRVLIARRAEGRRFAGLWELPGGRVEPGESDEEALAREFREEVGLEIAVGAELAVIRHVYTRFRVRLRAFEVRRLSGVARPLESAETRWVRLADLDRYAFPAANRKLIARLARR
jgi:A/G-specific adenine glycosylase